MNKQHKYIMPTDEEDAAINAGIAADPDTFELGDDFFDNAIRSSATTPQGIVDDVMKQYRGKQVKPTKKPISIRLSPEVLDFFRAQGKGWQTAMDDVLKDYVAHH